MKKHIIFPICIFVLLGIVVAVFYLIHDTPEEHLKLTPQQKAALHRAEKHHRTMTDNEVDTFTIGQCKAMLDQYMKNHHIHYVVGTQKYIDFVAGLSENGEKHKDDPKYEMMDTYASVYMGELNEAMVTPSMERFHLKKSTLNKTIKQIRKENEEKHRKEHMPK